MIRSLEMYQFLLGESLIQVFKILISNLADNGLNI